MDQKMIEVNSSTESKKKNKHITHDQKECMINFITENPEMITHSSTKENEKELWNELEIQLNNLQPAKSLNSWKNFWNRWQTNVMSKPESNLKVLDCRLKHFLSKIMSNEAVTKEIKQVNPSKNLSSLSIEEINRSLIEVEKERSKLNLEVDDNDFKILKYKSIIKSLEADNISKRKLIKRLLEKKANLNKKRIKLEMKKEIKENIYHYFQESIENNIQENIENNLENN